jgi:pimeloyl-ACP methyl ester carboxylesterase
VSGPALAPSDRDTPRARFLAWRAASGRSPRLERQRVRVRGLELAVWTTPPVRGTVPLIAVNGGLLFDHRSLWPTLAPLAAGRQLILYDQRGRGQSGAPPGVRAARIEHDAGDLPALRGRWRCRSGTCSATRGAAASRCSPRRRIRACAAWCWWTRSA